MVDDESLIAYTFSRSCPRSIWGALAFCTYLLERMEVLFVSLNGVWTWIGSALRGFVERALYELWEDRCYLRHGFIRPLAGLTFHPLFDTTVCFLGFS